HLPPLATAWPGAHFLEQPVKRTSSKRIQVVRTGDIYTRILGRARRARVSPDLRPDGSLPVGSHAHGIFARARRRGAADRRQRGILGSAAAEETNDRDSRADRAAPRAARWARPVVPRRAARLRAAVGSARGCRGSAGAHRRRGGSAARSREAVRTRGL